MTKRIALKCAELVIASMLVAAGVTAFEIAGLWIACRGRE